MKIYIRACDKQTVSRDEAVTPGGMLREGYSLRVPEIADGQRFAQPGDYIGFDLAFMDKAPAAPGRVTFRDTSVADATLNDALVARDVASAERAHGLRHAYLGDRAPAFTDAMRTAVRDAAVSTHQQRAASIRDGADVLHAQTVTSRVMRDASYAARRIELANAWKH